MYAKLVGIALAMSAFCHWLGESLSIHKINPNYAGSLYYIVLAPIVNLLYYFAFQKKYSAVFIGVGFASFLFTILNILFIQKQAINSYSYILLSTIIIVYAILYFFYLIRELPATHLQRLPMFWINSGYIIFHSGALLLYIFSSYLVNVLNNNLLIYWTFHNILGIVEVCIMLIAINVDLRNTLPVKNTLSL